MKPGLVRYFYRCGKARPTWMFWNSDGKICVSDFFRPPASGPAYFFNKNSAFKHPKKEML